MHSNPIGKKDIHIYFSKQNDEKFNITPKTKEQALSEFYEKYPKTEWWRLVVDGQEYDQGPYGEGEDGAGWIIYAAGEENCIRSYLTALEFCLNYRPTKVTIEFIQELKKLVEKDIPDSDSRKKSGGLFRTKGMTFSLDKERVTPEGLADLLDQIESGYLQGEAHIEVTWYSDFTKEISITSLSITAVRKIFECQNNTDLAICLLNKEEVQIDYFAPIANRLEELVSDALNAHYHQIEKAASLDHQLEITGRTIERLERIHPFPFTNTRTFVTLLLNYFLIFDIGLPPATFYQPNLFDAYGNHVNVIKKAVMNTVSIYHAYDQKIKVNLFDVESDNICYSELSPEQIKKEMDEIIQAAHAEYNSYIAERWHRIDFTNNNPEVLWLFKHGNFPNEKTLSQYYSNQEMKWKTLWDEFSTNITEFKIQLLIELFKKEIRPPLHKLWVIKARLENVFAEIENTDLKKIILQCHSYIASFIFDLEKKNQPSINQIQNTSKLINQYHFPEENMMVNLLSHPDKIKYYGYLYSLYLTVLQEKYTVAILLNFGKYLLPPEINLDELMKNTENRLVFVKLHVIEMLENSNQRSSNNLKTEIAKSKDLKAVREKLLSQNNLFANQASDTDKKIVEIVEEGVRLTPNPTLGSV